MTWLRRYCLLNYIQSSISILPALSMIVAIGAVRLLHRVEVALGWQATLDPAITMTVLATMASAMFTLIVFVCSALMISVQLASAQLTPRFIGLVFQNPVTRLSLTLFVLTFTFTLSALIRIKDAVPLLTAYLAAYSCLISLGVFLFMVDDVCKLLRPAGALGLVARMGRTVIRNVYPRRLADSKNTAPAPAAVQGNGEPRCTTVNPKDGVVLAFDIQGLVNLARRADCVIEMVPQVGDFVAAGQPLFRIFGEGSIPPAAALYDSVAVGPERTMQQDPAFAVRIIVDIASKGLSPAINDPTTAVLAIDQIQNLLRHLASRHLDEGQRRDARGAVRLIYRTPDWQDFVRLAVTEVRQFGGTSIQVARRLRAMLENLIQTLPEERGVALRQELKLLDKTAKRSFYEAEDQVMARVSDSQGVGGAPATSNESVEVPAPRHDA